MASRQQRLREIRREPRETQHAGEVGAGDPNLLAEQLDIRRFFRLHQSRPIVLRLPQQLDEARVGLRRVELTIPTDDEAQAAARVAQLHRCWRRPKTEPLMRDAPIQN